MPNHATDTAGQHNADDLGKQVDALLTEVEKSTGRNVRAKPPPTSPAPSVAVARGTTELSELSNQVDDLLKSVNEVVRPDVDGKRHATHAPMSIESLDEQIATTTEKLLDNDPLGTHDDADEPPPPPVVIAPKTPPPAAAPVEAPKPVAPAPTPVATPAPVQTVPAPAPEPAKENRLATAAVSALAKPLAGRPKGLRDSIGWLAANTLFIAACLWVYLLFIRNPNPDHAATTGFDFNASHLPRPAAEEPHAGGGAEKMPPAKKATKSAKAAPADAHAGGH